MLSSVFQSNFSQLFFPYISFSQDGTVVERSSYKFKSINQSVSRVVSQSQAELHGASLDSREQS